MLSILGNLRKNLDLPETAINTTKIVFLSFQVSIYLFSGKHVTI